MRGSKSICKVDTEYSIDKDNWPKQIEEIFLDSVDTLDKLKLESHTFSCLIFDGCCKPTLNYHYTIVWFSEKTCFFFHICDFNERMSKLNNRYWQKLMISLILLEKKLKNLLEAYCQL